MRIAIVHEWYEPIGGAEQVTEQILSAFPTATLHTLWNDTAIASCDSFLRHPPFKGRKVLSLPLMPIAFRTMSGDYDIVISNSHLFAHTVKFRGAKSLHTVYLSYVQTPARYIWYPEIDRRGLNPLAALVRPILRNWDRRAGQHVDALAANSTRVKNRIRESWGRESTVIHPPVDVAFFQQTGGEPFEAPFETPYLVSLGRWIPYKRHDFAIEVAAELNMPLLILGGGPLERELRVRAKEKRCPVRFVVHPSREYVRAALQHAACLIFAADEDFGIVPVEAMAAGCPVIALNTGGVLDTVEPQVGGVLCDRLDVREFARAVSLGRTLDRVAISQSSQRFSSAVFHSKLREWVLNGVEMSQNNWR